MAEEKKKPSYEELEQYASMLARRNAELENALRDKQMGEVVARLNFLFKVLENAKHFPKEYVADCIKDIQRVLVMAEPEDNKKEEPKGPFAVEPEKQENAE